MGYVLKVCPKCGHNEADEDICLGCGRDHGARNAAPAVHPPAWWIKPGYEADAPSIKKTLVFFGIIVSLLLVAAVYEWIDTEKRIRIRFDVSHIATLTMKSADTQFGKPEHTYGPYQKNGNTSIARYYDLPDSTNLELVFKVPDTLRAAVVTFRNGSRTPEELLARASINSPGAAAIENRDEYVWNNVDVNGTRWSEVIAHRPSRAAWRELTLKGRQ